MSVEHNTIVYNSVGNIQANITCNIMCQFSLRAGLPAPWYSKNKLVNVIESFFIKRSLLQQIRDSCQPIYVHNVYAATYFLHLICKIDRYNVSSITNLTLPFPNKWKIHLETVKDKTVFQYWFQEIKSNVNVNSRNICPFHFPVVIFERDLQCWVYT